MKHRMSTPNSQSSGPTVDTDVGWASYDPGTPWHHPDWRWRRVSQIIETGAYATRHREGDFIRRVVHYVRAINRALTSRGMRTVVKRYPDVYLALKVSQEPGRRQLEILARALAGQSDVATARAVGLPVSALATYMALFLDIRDRLKAQQWIERVVIGMPLDRPPSVETVMLVHCWRRGPSMIEPWLDYLQHQGERHDLRTEIGRQRAWLELLVEVQQLCDQPETRRSLWKNAYFALGKPPQIVKTRTVKATIHQNRAQILGEIRFSECDSGGVGTHGDPPQSAVRRGNRQSERYAQAG